MEITVGKIVFNRIKIEKKIGLALKQPRFEGLARNAANTRFVAARQLSLEKFDEHVITEELKEGSTAENSVLGYGNLASFLGLPDSAQSVAQVRNYLQTNLIMNFTPRFIQNKSNVIYEFKVDAPTLNEVYEAFSAPQKSYSGSWIKKIEEGMGNYAYYIFRLLGLPGSRSGTGLQRDTKRKWIEVPNSSPKIDWIKEILNNFLSYFRKK